MKTKEFVEKYQLNKGWKKSYQTDFLQDVTSELIALLEYNKAEGNLKGFDNAVRALRQKWDGISNKTPYGLPDGLWKYFFATTIAKMREQMCQKQMQQRREQQKRREEYREFRRMKEEMWEDEINRAQRNFYENLALNFLILSSVPVEEFGFIGLSVTATEDEIKDRYKELCLKMHPDRGGKQEEFTRLSECKNKCLKWASREQPEES